jgi:hypothetical protein
MSSNTAANNKMNNTSSIVYRSKLFNNSEPAPANKLFNTSEPAPANKLFNNSKQASAKQQQSSKPAFKTFCKVCQDAGKLEQEFTNHNVRDRTGRTVCTTLLAQECRNCFKHGHTVKYCPLLKEAAKAPVLKKPTKKPDAAKPKNVFMLLESDSEEEDVLDLEQEQEVTEFPALKASPVTNQKPVLNYGRIIDQANNPDLYAKAKEAQKEAERQKEMVAWAKAEAARQLDDEKERQARDERLKKIALKKCSWVDAESSDEDEDDEYNDNEQNKQVKVEIVDNSAW